MTTASANARADAKPATRRLDAAELADAAITAALVVALLAAGRVLASGPVFQVVASFVVAVLAARRRLRTVVIATIAAASIALLLGGLGPVSQAGLAGVFGWCGGYSLRKDWGRIRAVGLTLLFGWPAMAGSVMFFYPAIAINPKLRTLLFENVENQANGLSNALSAIGSLFGWLRLGAVERFLDGVGERLVSLTEFLIDNWLLLIPATELVYATIYALLIRSVGGGVLRRLERTLVEPLNLELAPSDAPAPLPVAVAGTRLTRNGTPVTDPIDLSILPGEHVVVEGANGAGKSTLLDALAGLDNVDAVTRPGMVGLGSVGGTARVGQRPEAQVVGTTIEEDLRWGIDESATTFSVDASLGEVGLRHLPATRPTSELSGGELQRLALAGALARKPQLLLVDEVTSMLDPEEQTRVTSLLNGLHTTAVVRTTHRNDAAPTDRTVLLTSQPPAEPHEADGELELRTVESKVTDSRLLRLRDVGYAHNYGRPWQLDVLKDLQLTVHRYEMVIIEGRNGSGKTTLARMLAGLIEPTSGTIERAEGMRRALAYQHVRLQLLRPSVEAEMRSLAGVAAPGTQQKEETIKDRQRIRERNLATAIELFDLGDLQNRRIDELSGGEQRRVLLGGLVARGVSLLVLDEPLAGLDARNRADLAETLDRVRLAGTSIVVVSHDIEWSPSYVSQRLELSNGKLIERPR